MRVNFTVGEMTYPYLIGIRHIREHKWGSSGKLAIAEKGGTTVISSIPDGTSILPRIYDTKCHPNDVYYRRLGLVYCLHQMVWDLFKDKLVIESMGYLEGGKILSIKLKDVGEDYVGYLNQNALTLARHGYIPEKKFKRMSK